jgi:hypothetical protein
MTLPFSSAIPGALAQVLVIAAAALPPATTVWFGSVLPTYAASLTLQVTEITGDQKPAELGNNYRREETFALVCSLTQYAGGVPDFPTLLTGLMANFSLLSSAVANNPTLNGAVRFAEVGNFLIDPETDSQGQSAVTLDFSIRCQQRVLSLSPNS